MEYKVYKEIVFDVQVSRQERERMRRTLQQLCKDNPKYISGDRTKVILGFFSEQDATNFISALKDNLEKAGYKSEKLYK